MKELSKKILKLLEQGTGLEQEKINNPSMDLLKIVSIILSECKCSIVDTKGNYLRYGSSINISVVEKIILTLLGNENKIPKELIKEALASREIQGPNVDINIKKIYDYNTQKIQLQIAPIMLENFEEVLGKNNSEMQTEIMEQVLKPYVKQLIFSNNTLMKRSPIGAFISKTFFKKKTAEQIKKIYFKILCKYIEIKEEQQVKNTVDYIVDNIMFNNMFKTELINKAINSTELQILGRVYTGFSGLVYNMITTTISMLIEKTSVNEELKQIEEIFNTIIGVLKVLGTDLQQLETEQIVEKIKQINAYFNNSTEKSNYRTTHVYMDIYGNNLVFVPYNYIETAMNHLCLRMKALLLNKDKITNEEYIKEVFRINYRFIRIQPFKTANGRTSRALINILLQAKGMSAYFENEIRQKYIKSLEQAHKTITKYEEQYINNLVNNPNECAKFEQEYLEQKFPIIILMPNGQIY